LNAAAATDRRPPLGIFAGSDDFWARFPRGVEVYDAHGNQIMRCVWTNPETGEVIRYPISDSSTRYFMGGSAGYRWILKWLYTRFGIEVDGELARIHSFLPAPLLLKAKPGRSGDDFLAVVSETADQMNQAVRQILGPDA
jgi:hypothetical protein